jgi:hypothetical protein
MGERAGKKDAAFTRSNKRAESTSIRRNPKCQTQSPTALFYRSRTGST